MVENPWKVARARRARAAKADPREAEEPPQKPEPTAEPPDPFYPPFKIEVNGKEMCWGIREHRQAIRIGVQIGRRDSSRSVKIFDRDGRPAG
jgi:hypothetical protein